MKKSITSFLSDGISKISSFINNNSTLNENEEGQIQEKDEDDSVFHDLEPAEEHPSLLFDDSLSFSRDVIIEKEENNTNKDDVVLVEKSLIEDLKSRLSHLESELEKSKTKIDEYEQHEIEKIQQLNCEIDTYNSKIKISSNENTKNEKINNYSECKGSSQCNEKTLNEQKIKFHQNLSEISKSGILSKNDSNVSFGTNYLVNAMKEKEKEIDILQLKISELTSDRSKLEFSLNVMEKDLVRSNEKREALSSLANEKIESLSNFIESLRDQLEFERGKNNKIKNDLNLSRKRCVEMIEVVHLLTNSD